MTTETATETPTETILQPKDKLTVDNCMQDAGYRALYPYMCAVARIAERLEREKAAREADPQAPTS